MIVKEYYAEGKFVFKNISSTLFSAIELSMMDALFWDTYKFNVLDIEDSKDIEQLTALTLMKNDKYYRSIKESYGVTFDPLKTTNLSETHSNTVTSKKDETDNNSMNVNKTVTGTDKTKVDKDIKENGTDKLITDETKIQTNNTTDKVVGSKTNNNTDTTKKSTFDNNVLSVTDEVESNSRDMNDITTERTGTVKNDTDATNNRTTSNTVGENSNIDNTTSSQTIDNTTHNKSYKANNTDTDNGTKSMAGYTNADFAKMISDIYETRKINVYDIVLRDIFNAICTPLYDFSEM